MGYHPRTPRDFGRRPRKVMPKTKSGKRRPSSGYGLEEEHVLTPRETVDRILNSLTRLGSQRFAVAPFYEHFDRWLLNLRTVLSELESNPAITVDDQFARECSQVLSDIELTLKERRVDEASREEAIRRSNQALLDARSVLAQTEREYVTKAKKLAGRKERVVKPVATKVGRLGKELNRIAKMRAGFLRGISKKTKAQKEAEASQRLDSTKSELTEIEQSFATEQEELRDEYKRRKQEILEQIAKHQKEIAEFEARSQTDDAVDARRAACGALINAVNGLFQRMQPTSEATSVSS